MSRRKAQQSLETHALIIRTAKELFMKSGYRAISTRQISDACGLTQPALYHHFADKQSIYVEVMLSICEGTKHILERIIRREPDIKPCLYQITYYMMANHPEDLSRMFHDIRHELSPQHQRTIYERWREAYLVPVISVFEEGQRNGSLRSSSQFGVDPENAARLLMGMINQSLASASTGAAFVNSASAPATSSRDWENTSKMLVNVLLFGLSVDNRLSSD
ncbi:TetR/AcrR family transcriptional regulator [Paenibacillus albus]|uniref:TetR/AcrR family transcriptional regulator n=1 Tax=Paenibacillus albus TaxID=2495582 RepID=A0A3Q8X718_9BACL|nr:TetR/AcrR family transcriptional regulator [Paenibacillus albus]AZN40328.1 TetR/AcrR family transcriptional regulator [Paenibacillus albus]